LLGAASATTFFGCQTPVRGLSRKIKIKIRRNQQIKP